MAPELTPASAPAEDHTPGTAPDETKLGDPGKAALDAERKARRDAEKALKDAQAQLAKIADQDKTETQRLTDRATAAEKVAEDAIARWHQAVKATTILTAATAASAIDADAVAALIDRDVTVTENGTVEGVEQAIVALQAAKPHLFTTQPKTPAGVRDATARTQPFALNSSGLEDALRAALGG